MLKLDGPRNPRPNQHKRDEKVPYSVDSEWCKCQNEQERRKKNC